ncbi:uncharacterized protein PG986_015071 [Apiospora aurea]|uniref:Uncharacterized protein n=1 Tax=Apiospora aurea TaxID=335848 RepID=A0ABR1PRI4_9PEZI
MPSETHELLAPHETVRAGSDRCSASSPAPSSSPPSLASPLASGDGKWAHIWSSWKWELLACVLVLATPLIMLATLYPHAGQPLPNWPFKITINALLSIYNVVFKTSVGFLAASAIGQLQWTCCLGSVYSANYSPGRLYVQLRGLEQATLPRTNFYVPEQPAYDVDDLGNTTGLGDPLRNALVHHSSGVEANCPTGNCTFPRVFGTMGFCSSCKDSSHEISFGTVCIANGNENGKNTTYKIENPTNFEECTNKSAIVSKLPDRYYVANLSATEIDGTDESIVVQTLMGKTTFSEPQIDMHTGKKWADCDIPASQESGQWKCQGYGAATCSLYPCVRMYNATVENGQLKERLMAHSDEKQLAVIQYGPLPSDTLPSGQRDSLITTLDAECLSPEETDIVRDQGHKIGEKVRWIPYNGRILDESFVSLLDRGCAYSIGRRFTWSTRFFLKNHFTSRAVTAEAGNLRQLAFFKGDEVPLSVFDAGRVTFERIDTLFSNISNALTTYIRTHGNKTYSVDAAGDVWHASTCLEVQWPWIAFHATLAVLTLLLVVLVLMASRQQPVWKASPLVWILRGPNENEITSGLPALDKMEEESKKMTISMRCSNFGFHDHCVTTQIGHARKAKTVTRLGAYPAIVRFGP